MAKNVVNIFKEIKNSNLQIAADRDCALLPVRLLRLNSSYVTIIAGNISKKFKIPTFLSTQRIIHSILAFTVFWSGKSSEIFYSKVEFLKQIPLRSYKYLLLFRLCCELKVPLVLY